jgi:uncharacterized membrane protein
MSPPPTKRYWTWWTLIVLVIAILVHVLSVWAVPRVIMSKVFEGVPAASDTNRAFYPPMTSAESRSIVMPSPDLLYAICTYDLAGGPVRVTANPGLDSYWSVALYSAASDNWYVINDRQAGGRPVDIVVAERGMVRSASAASTSAKVLEAPSQKGLVLMRVLAGDYANDSARYEAARRTFSCTQGPR